MHKLITGILLLLVIAGIAWLMLLTQHIMQLEKQLGPVIARQSMENRQNALHEKFAKRFAQDQQKYSQDQLREAEQLYQVANQKWGTPEAISSLQAMISKYPDLDRTGCAVLYLADLSKGADRARYLQDCVVKYNDCFYGDGVQVGAYARFLLAQDYKNNGDTGKAAALLREIKSNYPDAVDHRGNLLVDNLNSSAKPD